MRPSLAVIALSVASVCIAGCEGGSDVRRGTIIEQEESAALAADDASSDSAEEDSSREDPSQNPYSLVTASEVIGTSDGLRAGFAGMTANLPIKGSVTVTDGSEAFSDDNGDGDAESDLSFSSGYCTITYLTGDILGQFTLASLAGTEIVVTYQYLVGP